MTNRQQNYFF